MKQINLKLFGSLEDSNKVKLGFGKWIGLSWFSKWILM
jgi:hypothetical protein